MIGLRYSYAKFILFSLFFFGFLIVFYRTDSLVDDRSLEMSSNFYRELQQMHEKLVEDFYRQRKGWRTSNLGAILFKNATPAQFVTSDKDNRTFVVLVWKYWEWLKKRHSNKDGDPSDVLKHCSVKNCVFTMKDEKINEVDAVVVHTQRGVIPKVQHRNLSTRWIFLNDESPMNAFSLARNKPTLKELVGFNWTMLYRSDADIPIPYGRTVPLPKPVEVDFSDKPSALEALVPYWKKKTEHKAMVLLSNCMRFRIQFIAALQDNDFKVDIYGGCADKSENKKVCPGHFHKDCMLPAKYMFYLIMENSKCSEYITEKVFHHAFDKGAIPIIMGPRIEDCEKLLPPYSYIHVSFFQTAHELAHYLNRVLRDDSLILSFHSWRRHYQVLNEHGYFSTPSFHLCRVCEALNFNDRSPKEYKEKDLKVFLDKQALCDDDYGMRPISLMTQL